MESEDRGMGASPFASFPVKDSLRGSWLLAFDDPATERIFAEYLDNQGLRWANFVVLYFSAITWVLSRMVRFKTWDSIPLAYFSVVTVVGVLMKLLRGRFPRAAFETVLYGSALVCVFFRFQDEEAHRFEGQIDDSVGQRHIRTSLVTVFGLQLYYATVNLATRYSWSVGPSIMILRIAVDAYLEQGPGTPEYDTHGNGIILASGILGWFSRVQTERRLRSEWSLLRKLQKDVGLLAQHFSLCVDFTATVRQNSADLDGNSDFKKVFGDAECSLLTLCRNDDVRTISTFLRNLRDSELPAKVPLTLRSQSGDWIDYSVCGVVDDKRVLLGFQEQDRGPAKEESASRTTPTPMESGWYIGLSKTIFAGIFRLNLATGRVDASDGRIADVLGTDLVGVNLYEMAGLQQSLMPLHTSSIVLPIEFLSPVPTWTALHIFLDVGSDPSSALCGLRILSPQNQEKKGCPRKPQKMKRGTPSFKPPPRDEWHGTRRPPGSTGGMSSRSSSTPRSGSVVRFSTASGPPADGRLGSDQVAHDGTSTGTTASLGPRQQMRAADLPASAQTYGDIYGYGAPGDEIPSDERKPDSRHLTVDRRFEMLAPTNYEEVLASLPAPRRANGAAVPDDLGKPRHEHGDKRGHLDSV